MLDWIPSAHHCTNLSFIDYEVHVRSVNRNILRTADLICCYPDCVKKQASRFVYKNYKKVLLKVHLKKLF